MHYIYDGAGIAGVVLIIGSYLLMQTGKVDPRGSAYSAVNIVGSVLIMISLIYSWNLAAFIIEIFWLIISAYGLFRSRRKLLTH